MSTAVRPRPTQNSGRILNALTNPSGLVYVIDDDVHIRRGLARLFESVGLQVETFAATTEFLRSLRNDVPQCLVLEVRLQGLSGLDFQSQLGAANINIPIIFITAHGDIPMTVKAMKAGAIEFLTKPIREQDLLDAVQIAIDVDRSRRKMEQINADLQARFESLTSRERQVMTLVTLGKMNKRIAAEIGLSEITVKVHRSNLMKKMGAKSIVDLVRMAIAHNESCGPAESGPINGQGGGGTVVRRPAPQSAARATIVRATQLRRDQIIAQARAKAGELLRPGLIRQNDVLTEKVAAGR